MTPLVCYRGAVLFWIFVPTVVVLCVAIWVLLPNPGFVPGVDRGARPRHPFFLGRLMRYAHRGGDLEFPGETMEAFRHAAALGVDVFEIDVRLSADGILMLSHDAGVERMTDGAGRVRELSSGRLAALDAGWWWPHQDEPDRESLPDEAFPWRGKGLRRLTLRELFDAFPDMRMNIDCKDHDAAAMEALAVIIDSYERLQRTLVASFDHDTVSDFRERFPGEATAASSREAAVFVLLCTVGLGWLYKPSFPALQVPQSWGRLPVVTRRLVRTAHRLGINVAVWTVNDRASMERLVAMGVDGVISDRPSLLAEVGPR